MTACDQLDCACAVKRDLDPAYAPDTGTPEIGGYTPHEAQRMLRGLRGLSLVGGDVVEVSPPFDMSGECRPAVDDSRPRHASFRRDGCRNSPWPESSLERIYMQYLYIPNEGSHGRDRDRETVQAWRQPGRPAAQGIQVAGHGSARAQARARRSAGAAGIRCRCVACSAWALQGCAVHGGRPGATVDAAGRRLVPQMILLHTNVVIAVLKQQPLHLLQRFAPELRQRTLALSTIVLFELQYGVANSARRKENTDRLAVFLQAPVAVLPFEPQDAEDAGERRAELRRAGKPVRPFHLLVAAPARRRGAVLVTADARGVPRES